MANEIENINTELSSIRANLASIREQTDRVRQGSRAARSEVDKIKGGDISRQFGKITNDLNRGVQTALNGLIVERRSFKDVLGQFTSNFFQGLIQRSLNTNPFARITPFAQGGVLNGPTTFPLGRGGGQGLAGERGAEAILPLARSADGTLGVRGGAGRGVQINIHTPAPQQFFQSQAQLAAMVRRAVAQGGRNS